MARTAAQAGFERVIGFDMGGTSTDVWHFAGEFERALRDRGGRGADARADDEHPHRGGGRRLDLSASTARGSGSGPASAGANPGPACYRRGGPLTVTDCNVMLGKLSAGVLPGGVRPERPTSAWTATSSWRASTDGATNRSARPASAMTPAEIAEGFVTIAVENMAKAVRADLHPARL